MKVMSGELVICLEREMDNKVIVYLLFIVFMFAGSFGGVGFYYLETKEALIGKADSFLNSVVQSREKHVETWLDSQINFADFLGSGPMFKKLLMTNKSDDEYVSLLEFSNTRLASVIESQQQFFEASILNDEGMIIASSDEDFIGLNRSSEVIFLKGRDSDFLEGLTLLGGNKTISMELAVPFVEDGKKLGVFIVRVNAEELFSIASDKMGLGEAGEIYIINRDGKIVISEDVIFYEKIDTLHSRECFRSFDDEDFSHNEKEIMSFENNEGVIVLGTYAPVPRTNSCLLVEYNRNEIFSLLNARLLSSAFVILVTILIFTIVFAVIANRLLFLNGKKK